MGERVERRLAAVLAADVAGYSRLMGLDEEGTLARLKAARKAIVDPAIASHRGRLVKTTGDGLLIEFAADVGIEYPVHRLRRDGFAHHPQRLMSTASGSEAKGAIEEVGFIDGAQGLRHRDLDDFVFQRGDAKRPLTAVGLWDVRPANRQRPIVAAMDPVG